MTWLNDCPEWRARTEREHVPEIDIPTARQQQLYLHDLVQIHPDWRDWYEVPSQTPMDMLVFCALARKYLSKPDSIYAEVGTAFGGSLMLAAFSGHPLTRLVGVDLFDRWVGDATEDKVLKTAKRWNFDARLMLMKGNMQEVSPRIQDGTIDMFFVDSDHIYDTVKSDLEHCWPKVKPGGVLVGHDYEFRLPGCIQAVKEWSEYSRVIIPNESTMYFVEKEPDNA